MGLFVPSRTFIGEGGHGISRQLPIYPICPTSPSAMMTIQKQGYLFIYLHYQITTWDELQLNHPRWTMISKVCMYNVTRSRSSTLGVPIVSPFLPDPFCLYCTSIKFPFSPSPALLNYPLQKVISTVTCILHEIEIAHFQSLLFVRPVQSIAQEAVCKDVLLLG